VRIPVMWHRSTFTSRPPTRGVIECACVASCSTGSIGSGSSQSRRWRPSAIPGFSDHGIRGPLPSATVNQERP